MMKARADDRRIFDQGIQPQVRALVQTDDLDAEDVAAALNVTASKEASPPGLLFETDDNLFTQIITTTASPTIASSDVKALIALFETPRHSVPSSRCPRPWPHACRRFERRVKRSRKTNEIASRTAAKLLPVIEQAIMLAEGYDCVVANPPYMGSKYYNTSLKAFVNKYFKDEKADLCVGFIERAFNLVKPTGFVGEITMQGWMFLSALKTSA